MTRLRPLALILLFLLLAGGQTAVLAQTRSPANIHLNFVNADIESVIKAMGQMTGRTFIVDPRVKGTLNITSPRPVNTAVAYDILLAALRLQGYAAVESAGVVRVLPEADAKFYAAPLPESRTRGKASGEMATRLFRLRHEAASQLLPLLRPLVGPNSSISADMGSNSLVVTDYADNLARLASIIENLDMPRADEPVLITLKYAIAGDVATTLGRLFPAQGGAAGQAAGGDLDRLDIAVDARSNSLILRGRDRSRVSRAQNLVASLDTPTQVAGNIHVLYLKNAEATKVAQTLRAILASDPTAGQPANGAPLSGSASQAARSGEPARGAAPESGPGMVQADAASNALIITAPDVTFRNLKAVVEKLDMRRAQVLVEALIAEVSADKAAEFGIQWFNASGAAAGTSSNKLFGGFGTSGSGNILSIAADPVAAAAAGATTGLNLGVVKGQVKLPSGDSILNLGVLARALESEAGANILSIPTLLTLDNEEATISVGTNVPFSTGQFTLTGNSAVPFETIERKDVGITLRVKPQISEGGTVRLQIYQEVSKLRPNTEKITQSATDKRSIESTVLVDDGQIVVLGGLIEDQVQDVEDRVPLLGDIPLLGHLFRYTTRKQTKTNLMVFLRPQVVRDAREAEAVTHPRYRHIMNQQEVLAPKPKPLMPDVRGPSLRLDRGSDWLLPGSDPLAN